MKRTLFWLIFAALIVLHHDWWLWDDGTLVLGFLPIGLAYHVVFSVAAGCLWAWAVFDVYADIFHARPEEITVPTTVPGEGET